MTPALQSAYNWSEMNIPELDGKPFTLWLTDEDDESCIYSGTARWDGSTLLLERGAKPRFEIRAEWYGRIQAVMGEEARKILLGADYFLHLRLGDVPALAGPDDFEHTGLKWIE
jgi:hypothetical protein